MASLLAHAALPVLAQRLLPAPAGLSRRLGWVAMLLACAPDLDVLGYAFGVRHTELLGHRGLTHGLPFAALLAAGATALWFRALPWGSPALWRVFGVLFAAAASHGLLDAATAGEVGVALLSPLSGRRLWLPWKLLPSCPLGMKEYLGFWGLLTLANELLYAVLPLGLLVALVQAWRAAVAPAASVVAPAASAAATSARWQVGLLLGGVGAWAGVVGILRLALPQHFIPVQPRPLRAVGPVESGDPQDLPRDGVPGGRLLTRLPELQAQGLLGRRLTPENPIWSSSFFPSWYGSESGRWTEGTARLIGRTLFGFLPPGADEARGWLAAAGAGDAAARARLYTLAPTEKFDLVYGRFDFPATVQALSRSHNGKPRYWNGRCNGVSSAAMVHPEPHRAVEVIGVTGARVRFHPNDIKALLAIAYDQNQAEVVIGDICNRVAFDAAATCSMNPAVLVLALANRVGLARRSFLVDLLPTAAKQYYAVAAARIDLRGAPRPPGGALIEPALVGQIASLVEIDLELVLSSTTLPYAPANVVDPAFADGTHYLRVGLRPVVMHYRATLALGADGALIGGRWDGDPAEGPDVIAVVSGGPALLSGQRLIHADQLTWPLIRELARASTEETAAVPTLDLRTACDGRCRL